MPLEGHEEVIMKTLNASQPSSGGSPASRFESAKALAFSIAEWPCKLT
jgi:hypothetical protein